MQQETVRHGVSGRRSGRRLRDLLLEQELYSHAWRSFLNEDYEASLTLARQCLDQVPAAKESHLTIVPCPGAPTVQDAVVLVARNLYQLDRHGDFEVLLASAGRWDMVPDRLPQLDVVHLAFACKRGSYRRVVDEASAYIDAHRTELPPVIAEFLHLRGLAYSHLGDPARAREDAEAAYALFRVLDRSYDGARTANLLGMVAFRGSRYAEAERWWRRAHELHAKLGMIKNMGGNRLNLGIVCYKQGQFDRAVVELEAASRLLEEVDARVSLCRASIALGNVLRLQGHREEAARTLRAAFGQASELELSREEAIALEFLGDVHRDEGRPDSARRYYSRALAIGGSIAPEGDIVMEVLRRQAECLLLLGRHTEALKLLNQALGLARRLGDGFEEGVIRRVQATALVALADFETAETAAREAVRWLREVGGRHELGQALLAGISVALARIDAGLVDNIDATLDLAWQDALAALDLFLKMDVEEWILTTRRVLSDVSERKQDLERHGAPNDGRGRKGRSVNAVRPIIHVSSRMRDLIQLTDAFADSEEPVLVTGETGTGKELFARRLHDKSRRRQGELVCVNVSAIPDSIFGREFFGHVRGSFSGADSDGIGLAAKADGGTLFLDEIGDLPLELQPQLLRLLQDGTYQAIGDPTERRVDIRLIAATNADLKRKVAEGTFRADLYYRLKILELRLPPMRDRSEDVLPLLRHFLTEATGRPVDLSGYFNEAGLDMLRVHDWPGNVREIATVARQAHVQLESRGRVEVELDDVSGACLRATGPDVVDARRCVPPLEDGAVDLDRSRLVLALAEARGNRARAARRLGISRSTLYRKMDRLGIACKATAN